MAGTEDYPFERWQRTVDEGWAGTRPLDDASLRGAVEGTVAALDAGDLRVASPPAEPDGEWTTHAWVKEAILLYFRMRVWSPCTRATSSSTTRSRSRRTSRRPACASCRRAWCATAASSSRASILMPGYVNIGARVGAGTMVDTWATVGSCAQVGARVHLSGGVGIGGVLEPPRRAPGHRSRTIASSARAPSSSRACASAAERCSARASCSPPAPPIIDVRGDEPVEIRGRVPAGAVVIPGHRPKKFPAGDLRRALRAAHRHAQREHRPQDLAQRRAARVRGAGLTGARRQGTTREDVRLSYVDSTCCPAKP